jgi:hypothetical protein
MSEKTRGADPKGQVPQKMKNIWPALAGYIFFRDNKFLSDYQVVVKARWQKLALELPF